MDRVATVVLTRDPDGQKVRLAQLRYRSDPGRPERLAFRHELSLPEGGPVLLESECADATGMLSMLVQYRGREVLRAICRWDDNDPPFLRVRLDGVGLLTLQFVPGLLADGGPEH